MKDKLTEKELIDQLIPQMQKNREGVVRFAARSGLRVLPLIFEDPGVWSGKDRVVDFLSIWRVLLGTYCYSIFFNLSSKDRVVDAKLGSGIINDYSLSAIRSAVEAFFLDKAISNFAPRSHVASPEVLKQRGKKQAELINYSKIQVVDRVVESVSNAFAAFEPFNVDAINTAINSDVSLLLGGHNLLKDPLWKDKEDLRISDLFLKFEKFEIAINIFIKNKLFIGEKHLLINILPIYKKITEGHEDIEEIKNEIFKLNQYFESLEGSEKEKISATQLERNAKQGGSRVKGENDDNPKIPNETSKEPTPEIIERYDPESWLSPHTPSVADKLNREKLVSVVAQLCANKKNTDHQTLGLLGDWGVGKSTFINLLKESLIKNHSDQPFLFADFNAWEYEHTDNLQAGIAQEVITALTNPLPAASWFYKFTWHILRPILVLRFAIALHDNKLLWPLLIILIGVITPFMTKDALDSYLSQFSVNPVLPQLLWGAGFLYYFWTQLKPLLASPKAKEWFTYLKLPEYGQYLGDIPVMQKHIKVLTDIRLNKFGDKGKRLLFVVDDLDRCGHEGIIKVLEAVRLVLDLDQVIVVIAVDHRIAMAALALHYDELSKYHCSGDAKTIARDYLAKIIHLPIVLSSPDKISIEGYLDHLWGSENQEKEEDAEEKNSVKETGSSEVINPQNTVARPVDTETSKPNQDSFEENSLEAKAKIEMPSEEMPIHRLKANDLEVKVRLGLSPDQKTAFKYWLDYFNLCNPRQVKRLNHSYQLLRLYYGEDELAELDSEIQNDVVRPELLFRMMLTLFALEYINQLDDHTLRSRLKKSLIDKLVLADDPLIDEWLIEVINNHIGSVKLIDAVEPFILPAIDSDPAEIGVAKD